MCVQRLGGEVGRAAAHVEAFLFQFTLGFVMSLITSKACCVGTMLPNTIPVLSKPSAISVFFLFSSPARKAEDKINRWWWWLGSTPCIPYPLLTWARKCIPPAGFRQLQFGSRSGLPSLELPPIGGLLEDAFDIVVRFHVQENGLTELPLNPEEIFW